MVERHASVDAWVDSAVNDAWPGVGDATLGPDPERAAHTGVWHLEDVLPGVVLPLADIAPTLLLVLDGMSCGVGTEVIGGDLAMVSAGWVEALLPGHQRFRAYNAIMR